jgi:AraC-like DNA-binding protein
LTTTMPRTRSQYFATCFRRRFKMLPSQFALNS